MDTGSDSDKSEQEFDDNEEDSSSETDQESGDDEEDSSSETDQESHDDDDGDPSNQIAAQPSVRSKENEGGETNQPSQQELYSRAIQLCKEPSNDNLQTLRQNLFKMMKSQLSVPSVRTVPDRHIRIASWNLTDYNSDEVIWEKKHLVCETIKYHNFDIVALQGVGERDKGSFAGSAAIVELKEELGEDWDIVRTEDKVGKIKQKMPVYGVFLYNKSRNITCTRTTENGYLKTLTKLQEGRGRRPTLAEFTKKENEVINVSLLSLHLLCIDKSIRREEIKDMSKLKIDGQSEFLIILGNFNQYIPSTCIESTKYQNILQKRERTNTKGRASYDGILVPQNFYTSKQWIFNKTYGVAEIAEKGGIKQRHVSNHKPIWADISIDDINAERFDKSDPGRLPCVEGKFDSTTQRYQLQ